MIKLIHTADWHLGAPNLPSSFEHALEKLILFAKENKIGTILCVGDIFDRPKPVQRIKDYLLEQLCTNKDINFIFIPGNHDYETKELEYHSLEYLKTLENTHSLDNVSIIEPGNSKCFGKLNVVSLKEYEEIKDYAADNPTVLTWHGTPKGVDFSKGVESYSFKEINKPKNIYIAFGDIHKHLWPYSGSLVQKTFGCESGFYVVTYDEENNEFTRESKNLDLPKRITISVPENLKEKDLIKFVKKTAGEEDLVKLKFNMTIEQYAALDKTKLKDILGNVILTNDQKVSDTKKYSETIKNTKSLDEELLAFINKLENIDKKKLFLLCKKYFVEQ